ncbi:16S rRNA (uracil(1498)-N(3))-methyltransferase [Sphingobacterium psychroaquaticum]|uniref:16S rRNA (uracil(1498)-N(3))-methyltransferase n=1 Tax=Sphingobacterium psychroaquaticum TaxID=561061 RepID=UPI00106DBB36|nr:16S rRNA (uracil(1498)-N(3))-methyltransferase [Sphingobacterium psychroaquaticum]QBQ40258.1 16S rRNA (uracil(1498)-N(3))-methyltransferase [Sphingobacterium psychroaquaticum]
MHLFYTADIAPHHKQFLLSEEESKHAIRVLRLQQGDAVVLVDGVGGWYDAEIIDPHPKRTTLQINRVEVDFQKSSYHLHIAVAPTKNIDRIEWFLEKATEIGIQEVTPIISEHSERKEVKVDRLNKVVASAMKQSLKAYLPKINPAITFTQFLKQQAGLDQTKLIAHCAEGEKRYVADVCQPKGSYLILIGPEGDFSSTEINDALTQGFAPVSLGDSRLRTETAALVSCVEFSLLNRG